MERRKGSGMSCLSSTMLQYFIVLSVCVLCILGGIAPDKANAKDQETDIGNDMRPKRQDPSVNLFYTSQCEGKNMDLRCPDGRVILIEWANFGRTDTETCLGYGPVDDTDCKSEGASFEIVSQIDEKTEKIIFTAKTDIPQERVQILLINGCNHKQSCSIHVSNATFPDNCPKTFKYLEVSFECVIASTTTINPTTPVKQPTTLEPQLTTEKSMPTPRITTGKPKPPKPIVTQPPVEGSTERKRTTEGLRPTVGAKTTEGARSSQGVRTTMANVVTTQKVPTTTHLQTCPAVEVRGVSWPETTLYSRSTQPCPTGSTGQQQHGQAAWYCGGSPARWTPEAGPDLSACVSVWVQNITKLATDGAPTAEVTQAVVESVTSTEELYGGDIIEITEILDNSVENLENEIADLEQPEREVKTKEVTENYVTITSSMLETTTWDDLTRIDQSDTASQLINSLEESAFLLADNLKSGSTITTFDNNVVLEIDVQDVSTITTPVIQFPKPENKLSKIWKNISDSISIPTESIKERTPSGAAKVVFVTYNNLEDLLGTQGAGKFMEKTSNEVNQVVNSRILSASINDPLISGNLVQPAVLTFQHKQIENVSDPVCAFWHFINKTRGEWSDDGCILVTTNKTHTTCECNHLTNFAIIMNVRGVEIPIGHHFALSVITYAGFIISVICLMMAFVTFSFFKNIQNDRNTIHKNLVLCLLIAEIIFLAGISQTAKTGVCTAVALSLHYFFLASFCWMCLEGIQLYVMLVEVFEAESSRRKYYYPFGYGVPLLIVGVSAAIDFNSYGTEDYCWLAVDNNFIWAFAAPVCLVILVNTIFLTMAIVIMCRHTTMQTNPKEKTLKEKVTNGHVTNSHYRPPSSSENIIMGETRLECIISWLRGALVLLCLLGITWAFGLMYVSADSIVFAYIFTIANAFQGLFIFVFHCFMNDKVRKEYRRYVRNNDWIPDCIQNKYGGSYGSNQPASFRSSSSNGKRAAKDEAKRLSATTGSTSCDRDRKFSASSYRNSGEYQPVKFTSLIIKTDNKEQAEKNQQRMSDEGIGLDMEDFHTPTANGTIITDFNDTPVSNRSNVGTPDVYSNSESSGSSEAVVTPTVSTPVKLGNKFEKQPLLNESPLRFHSPSDDALLRFHTPEPDGYPDAYPDALPELKRDIRKNNNKCNTKSMPDLVYASSPWKVRKMMPPSPTYKAPPNYTPPIPEVNTLNQSLPNLPHSPVMQRKSRVEHAQPTYKRLNSEALTSPWAPRTPRPEEAIAIDQGPVEMVGYRKLKLETVI